MTRRARAALAHFLFPFAFKNTAALQRVSLLIDMQNAHVMQQLAQLFALFLVMMIAHARALAGRTDGAGFARFRRAILRLSAAASLAFFMGSGLANFDIR